MRMRVVIVVRVVSKVVQVGHGLYVFFFFFFFFNTNLLVDKTGSQARLSRIEFFIFVCFNMVMAFCMDVNDCTDSVLVVEGRKSLAIKVDYFFGFHNNNKRSVGL